MAKRYIKIGWENKPSVKTPVNMANLGRMDKGIDDCDNAIEEIYSKRVNNVVTTNEDTFLAGPVGKVLQDQVTELNKNMQAVSPGKISINDCSSFAEIVGIVNANKGKTGTGNIGNLESSNLKTLLENPEGFANYTTVNAIYEGADVIHLYAVMRAASPGKLAHAYVKNIGTEWTWTGWIGIT